MKKNKHAFLIFCLSFAALLILAGTYLLWNFGTFLPKVGSVTEHAAVYSYNIGKRKLYRYIIQNNGNILERSDLSIAVPYLWQDSDNHVTVHESEDGEDYLYYFDLTTGNWLESDTESSLRFLNPFSRIEKIQTVSMDTGCTYAKAYDLSAQGEPEWFWEFWDANGDLCWCDTSETAPEVRTADTGYTLFYTQEDLPLCREFTPENGDFSDEYALLDDGRIYVTQAIGSMLPWGEPEGSVREDGFVNTEPTEITDCNAAYLLAKNEVTIPYNLVTFRGDVNISEMRIGHWAVTFTQKEDPESASQTVFMDGDGVTLWVVSH